MGMLHLEIVVTLKGCLWDLEDENAAVLMFKPLSPSRYFSSVWLVCSFFRLSVYIRKKWIASCGFGMETRDPHEMCPR